jgi:hypothetical protein
MMSTNPSNAVEKKVDWEVAKACLAELQREAPGILQQAVIIGGIACWFYRNLLTKANDPDFKTPHFTSAEENFWLSKDIDFTNYFAEDARNLLHRHVVADTAGRRSLQIAGVPIGFAQVGLTFDPETAWADSWITRFDVSGTTVECRILDPVALYREKSALAQRRGSNSDQLHCSTVAEFLRYEICKRAASLDSAKALQEKTLSQKFLMSVRDQALEVCNDKRLLGHLRNIIARTDSLTPAERKLLTDLSSGFEH